MRERLCGCVVLLVAAIGWCVSVSTAAEGDKALTDKQTELRARLKKLPFRIVYESYRGKDWELFLMNADGSAGVNLTKTPDADNLAKFVCDSLNGVFWRDDSIVCELTVTKAYNNVPRTEIVIESKAPARRDA